MDSSMTSASPSCSFSGAGLAAGCAGLRWSLPLPTLYLLVTAGTGGILWQSLAAEGRSPNLENPCMLPVSSRTFVFSYVAALGSHTLLTKTVPL